MNTLTKKQKRNLIRILVSALLFTVIFFLPVEGVPRLLLFLLPYLVVGYDVLLGVVRGLFAGELLDERFLMMIASVGAIAVGEAEEGVFVMLFYQVGELFQSCAVTRSRRAVSALMDIRPEEARVDREGEVLTVDPEEVAVGEIIEVRPGERIPLDGTVLTGEALVNTAALTGESVPRRVGPGDAVQNGCVDESGLIRVCVTAPFSESTVTRILDLVENASEKKAKAENFITRFARWYTPAVVCAAVLCAVLPPLVGLGAFSLWIHRALIFLVVSCPCALVISVPLGFFGGIGGASSAGILIKGSNYMEVLANTDTVLTDKTGTLTKGVFRVTSLHPAPGIGEERLLRTASAAESSSLHPIARSIRTAFSERFAGPESVPADVTERAGMGVSAAVDGKRVLAGSRKFLLSEGVAVGEDTEGGTVVHLSEEGQYLGSVVLGDEIREDSVTAVERLHRLGVRRIVMLTGDREETAAEVSGRLGLDGYRAGLMPEDKVTVLEEYLNAPERHGSVVYIGDGINDAPVLMRADAGIAMGGLGSDAAIEAADTVIMTDEPGKIASAIAICRKTVRIVRENIVFALAVKVLIMLLGVFGLAGMWLAAFADVGVAVIAILNSMRTLNVKREDSIR